MAFCARSFRALAVMRLAVLEPALTPATDGTVANGDPDEFLIRMFLAMLLCHTPLRVWLCSESRCTRRRGYSRQSCGRIPRSGIHRSVRAVSLACIDRQQYSKDSDKPRQTYLYSSAQIVCALVPEPMQASSDT